VTAVARTGAAEARDRHESLRQREMKRGLRVLLFALLLLLVTYPLLSETLIGKAIFVVLSTAIMLAGAYASSRTRRALAAALLLAMPAMITRWSDLFVPSAPMLIASIVSTMFLYAYIAVLVFRRILNTGEVSAEELYGGLAVYILMGLVWADACWLLEAAAPGSYFTGGEPASLAIFIYYSFSTLMTVGFGDIRPVGPLARSLATFESLGGIFFMAVFISRLVGLAQVRR
jgi:Ion channel